MWPWEHVLFAYVFYSVFVHFWFRARPTDWPVAALAFGSLLPDLVDKPLAWQFGLFETGWAIAHSVFVAVPLSLLAYAVARYRGADRVGIGFAFGYLLHLVGDVLPASLSRGELYLTPVLWPFGNPTVSHSPESFAGGVLHNLGNYLSGLVALDMTPVLALQLGALVVGLGLWVYDGFPGLRLVVAPVRRAAENVRRS